MAIKTASRGVVPAFLAMDVMRDAAALEAQGRRVVHLEVGQPATGLPKAAAARLRDLIGREPLGYTVAAGLPELRAKIASLYRQRHAVDVDPEQVFITTGSSGGFLLAFLAAFEAGDRVALGAPGYPAYRHILTALGVTPELIPVGADTRYQPTVADLKALPRLPDGLILASPANPSGTVIPPAEFRDLVTFCDTNGIRLISDEIYHGLTYGAEVTTAAGLSPHAIIVTAVEARRETIPKKFTPAPPKCVFFAEASATRFRQFRIAVCESYSSAWYRCYSSRSQPRRRIASLPNGSPASKPIWPVKWKA